MTKRILELFSGTHSIGKVAKELGYEVYSLDISLGESCPFDSGYTSDIHFEMDIHDFDETEFDVEYFDIITASPVCAWWSKLRNCNIGRKKRNSDEIYTRESLQADIDNLGKPMVDKVRQIIDYLKPKYYWIENPSTGRMKEYITDLSFYDVDYCRYCDWGYRKPTRIWTNIEGFEPLKCEYKCNNLILRDEKYRNHKNKYKHRIDCCQCSKYERYRVPENLIRKLLDLCQ